MANLSLLAKLGINTKGFKNGMDRAQKRVDGFGKRFGRVMTGLGAKLGAIGVVLAVKKIGMLGVAAEETASKFKAVFGPATDQMNEKIKELQQTIPATVTEMQNSLATFAAMAKGFGMSREAANQFSVEMVKIGGDIASFHNLRIEDAFQKIRSAISGEMEPLKALGIVINEDRIKTEALSLGIIQQGQALTIAGKAMAIYSLMVRDMGDANGDAAITANSAANQLKFLRQQITDNFTEMGTKLTPAIATLTTALSTMVTKIVEGTTKLGQFIGEVLFMGGMDPESFAAKLELQQEGAFDGLVGRGGTNKIKKLIEERVKLNRKLKEAAEQLRQEEEEAANERLQQTDDLVGELQKQLDVETDPRRRKALEDRLAVIKEILAELEKSGVALAKLDDEIKNPPKTGDGDGDGKGSGKGSSSTSARSAAKEAAKLSGDALARLATETARGKGMGNTRFEKYYNVAGDERFRRFDGGSIQGDFSRGEIAKGIGKAESEETAGNEELQVLKNIEEELKGKFVNE